MVLVKRRVAIKASADQIATAYNLLVDYFNSKDVVLDGVKFTAPALLADGTAAAPGLAFALDTDTGIWRNANNQAALTAGGTTALVWMATGIQATNATVLQGLNVGTATGAPAGEIRASGNVVSGGDVSADGNLIWKSNTTFTVTLDHAATANQVVTVQNLTGTMALLGVANNGGAAGNLLFTDNTYDIGAAGATRPRNLYLAGSEVVDGTATVGAATTAAALHALVTLQRAAATKGSLGLDALDNLAVLNAAGASVGHVEAGFFLPTVPCARVNASGTSVGSASFVALSMDSAAYDTDTLYDAGNHRLKATRPGKYRVAATASFGVSALGTTRLARVIVNGGAVIAQEVTAEPSGGFNNGQIVGLNLSTTYLFAVNDFVTVECFQDSGGPLTVNGSMTMDFISN